MSSFAALFFRDAKLLASCQKQIVRSASTNNKVHFKQINSSLQLLHKDSHPEQKRPLVLLYAWLAAKSRHKRKYADFYLDKGFDVLHVDIKPTQLLYPSRAQAIGQNLLDLLLAGELRDRDLVVHTFSVGAYLYAEVLVKFAEKPHLYGDLLNRVKGHIYDSPVGRTGIPEGFPKALTRNEMLVNLTSRCLNWYLNRFEGTVTRHYDLAERTTLSNENAIPALFLYSETDPVAQARIIEMYVDQLKRNGNAEIWAQCWPDSPHVSHMHRYPQEYMSLVSDFLHEIGFDKILLEQGELEGQKTGIHE